MSIIFKCERTLLSIWYVFKALLFRSRAISMAGERFTHGIFLISLKYKSLDSCRNQSLFDHTCRQITNERCAHCKSECGYYEMRIVLNEAIRCFLLFTWDVHYLCMRLFFASSAFLPTPSLVVTSRINLKRELMLLRLFSFHPSPSVSTGTAMEV